MRLGKLIAVGLLALLLGCSNEPAPVSVTPVASPAKGVLEEYAKTGEMGSGILEVQTAVDNMKQTDAAKAAKLDGELQALQKETDKEKVKAKAKALADQF